MKLKYLFVTISLFLGILGTGLSQNQSQEGKVTFTTQKSIYVRFSSTEGIKEGDTLSVLHLNTWRKLLLVRQKSSTSCVTENLDPSIPVATGQIVQFSFKTTLAPVEENVIRDSILKTNIPATEISNEIANSSVSDTLNQKTTSKNKSLLNGRFTISTNGMLNADESSNFQRVRAAFSMNAQHINNSPVSLQTYLTYRYRYGLDQVNKDFFNDFKVFSLSLEYAPEKPYRIWAGRRINSFIANLGTIDGVQAEYSRGKYIFGTFAGTRPDFTNFGFNINLPQFGVYAVRNDQLERGGNAQTTLSLSEQQNHFKTDRRFLYFQHSNSMINRLNLFFSSEMDIYTKENGISASKFRLTSMYASVRYRIRKNLSLTGSYDNRRNIIYYESYQTFIDQLIAEETRQGLRLQLQYSPFRFISLNTSAFWRYQGDNPRPTTNYIGNVTIMSLPGSFKTINLSVNFLESYYFKGRILGTRINGQLFKNKVGLELQYRHVDYNFFSAESSLQQHIGGSSVSIPLFKKSVIMLNYEGTFESTKTYHRYFVTFVQRFK